MIIIGFILIAFFLRVISVKKYQKQIDDLLQQRMSELKSNEKIQEEIIDMETKMDRYKNRIGDLEEALQKADDEINKLKSKQ
jgi:peptidoglycan hydrolase CwlO-like protein